MEPYLHHVSGFFAQRGDADSAMSQLIEQGLPREQIQIFKKNLDEPAAATEAESNGVLKDLLVDGAIGTAVGTGLGALAEVSLLLANVSLFIASPLIAPLTLLGWGASVGGLFGAVVGATAGSGNQKSWFSDLVRDAISSGQVVVLVETKTKQETMIAREIIQGAVGAFEDIHAA